MRLRTFTAESLPAALGQVRAELGDDAVILSTQEEEGASVARVTAAIEDHPMDAIAVDGDAAAAGGAALDEVRTAVEFHRVPPGLADRLLVQAAGLVADSGAMALAAALDVELLFDDPSGPLGRRPLMLVGPPGAGKTATAAKFGALARLDGRNAAVITMDTLKAGGLAQIETFAEALSVRLRKASNDAALAAAVAELQDAEMLLIDTVGANPYLPQDLDRLRTAATTAGADMLVVLPAGGDPMDTAEAAIAFAEIGAIGLVVTKIDVARRLGGSLGAAQVSGLPLVAAGVAPNIGDGLIPLNPVALARLLIGEPAPLDRQLRATGTNR